MMAPASVYADLTTIFRDLFLRDDLTLDSTTTAKDVTGWDSIKQIEIMIAIEIHWNIRLQVKDFEGLDNVGQLVDLIIARTGKGHA